MLLFYVSEHLPAVNDGHVHVEQEHVEISCVDGFGRLGTVAQDAIMK